MTKKTYLHIPISKELMEKIDNYRFDKRFSTKSDAVRFLLEYAIKQNPKP